MCHLTLLSDRHSSYYCPNATNLKAEQDVIPPNTTHLTQQWGFSPFKHYCNYKKSKTESIVFSDLKTCKLTKYTSYIHNTKSINNTTYMKMHIAQFEVLMIDELPKRQSWIMQLCLWLESPSLPDWKNKDLNQTKVSVFWRSTGSQSQWATQETTLYKAEYKLQN